MHSRRVAHKRQRRRCAVDANETAGSARHVVEIAAIDKMKPANEPKALRMFLGECRPMVKAAVERMRLQKKMYVARRIRGEALDGIACRALHIRKGRCALI